MMPFADVTPLRHAIHMPLFIITLYFTIDASYFTPIFDADAITLDAIDITPCRHAVFVA